MANPSGSVFRAFRHPKFVATFSAGFVSSLGDWMQIYARTVLAYDLTKRAEAVGLIYFVSYIPQLLFSLWGGVLVDRLDRRKVFVWMQVVEAGCAGLIAVLVMTDQINLLWLSVISFVAGTAMALAIPAGSALTPAVVPMDALTSAISLSTAQNSVCRVLGPLVAVAIVSVTGGTQLIFWVNALSFLGVIIVWMFLRIRTHGGGEPEPAWDALKRGLRYVRETPTVATPIGIAAFLGTFGIVYQPLAIAFATTVLAAGNTELGAIRNGWFQAAVGVGASLGILALARIGERRPATTYLGSAIVFSALTIVLGVSSGLVFVLFVAFLIGAFQFTNITLSVNLVQHRVPEALRGRVMALQMIALIGGVPIAALVSGWLADRVGVRTVISASGVVCLVFSLVALRWARYLGDVPIGAMAGESIATVNRVLEDEG